MRSSDRILDVLIVGAGPAGMFTARRLLDAAPGLRVAILDKGRDARSRALRARPDEIISGGGGAGLYSDGKLTLTLDAGGKLGGIISDDHAAEYVRYIDRTLVSYDGMSVLKEDCAPSFVTKAREHGLAYKHLPIRHFGTEALKLVVTRFFDGLGEHPHFRTFFGCRATGVTRGRDHFILRATGDDGEQHRFLARHVVFAVGKEGSPWLVKLLRRFGVAAQANRTYFGVRVESPYAADATAASFDPKLSWRFSDGTKMKTHCFCRRGHVLPLRYFDLPLAGSHSPFTEKYDPVDLPPNSVFGVLLGDTPDTRIPFNDTIGMMRRAARAGRGELLVQRYGDFVRRRATTEVDLRRNALRPTTKAVPGNVAALDLALGFNEKFIEFMTRLARVEPAVLSEESLVYALAAEWWMPRIETSDELETVVPRLYAIGDGAGMSQGITYSAATGIIAADAILRSL